LVGWENSNPKEHSASDAMLGEERNAALHLLAGPLNVLLALPLNLFLLLLGFLRTMRAGVRSSRQD
jgi:hypothetical protein